MTAAQLADKLLANEHADVLRESVVWIVAELMDAEVAAQIGAEHGRAHRPGDPPQRLPGPIWDTRVGEVELRSPGCGTAGTSRRSSSHAGGPSRPWSRSSRRPMSTGSRPGGWTGWSSSSASPA